jgi:hypothetical protein
MNFKAILSLKTLFIAVWLQPTVKLKALKKALAQNYYNF